MNYIKTANYLLDNHEYIVFALKYHKTHKNIDLDFNKRSFLRQIYFDDSHDISIIKSTQCGISEWLSSKAIYWGYRDFSVFYVLPTWELKNRFVKNRIDRSIKYSDFYSELIRSSNKGAESASLKHIGNGSISFNGSNSPNAFTEYPADKAIIDEYDRCDQDNLNMVDERLANSKEKAKIKVSNPTILNFGIDLEYKESDQKVWHIKHDCGQWIEFDFFKQVVREIDDNVFIFRDKNYEEGMNRDIHVICEHCDKKMNRFQEGEWIAKKFNMDKSGYTISKLFSTETTILDLIDRFNKGLVNDVAMERFYNGDLGKAFTSKGAKIDREMVSSCVKDFSMPESSKNPTIAGIDVGKVFNVVIGKIQDDDIQILNMSEPRVENIDEILQLFNKYNVKLFVIDALPETRISNMIIARSKAHGFKCYYTGSKKDIIWNVDENRIDCDRTYILDSVKEMFFTESYMLPKNSLSVENFVEQITCSTRVFDEKHNKYNWVETGADHYFHAMAYLNLARLTIKQLK